MTLSRLGRPAETAVIQALRHVREGGGRGTLRVELRRGQVYKIKISRRVPADQDYTVGEALGEAISAEALADLMRVVQAIRADGGMGEITLTIEGGCVQEVTGDSWCVLDLRRER